jgi:cytoskeletal protein CcmA (bactofilin family)
MALRVMRRPENGTVEAPAGASAPTEATYIDAGAELVGTFSFKESVRLDGRVEGEIRAARTVTVGETAVIAASIEADSVVVFGTVDGDIRVKRKITLHRSARVTGEIHTAGIVVEEGARFRGCILIGDDEAAAASAPAAPAPGEKPSARPDSGERR